MFWFGFCRLLFTRPGGCIERDWQDRDCCPPPPTPPTHLNPKEQRHVSTSTFPGQHCRMSWFKRTSSIREDGRVAINGRSSPAPGGGGGGGGRDRANTDPDTCFEVSDAESLFCVCVWIMLIWMKIHTCMHT